MLLCFCPNSTPILCFLCFLCFHGQVGESPIGSIPNVWRPMRHGDRTGGESGERNPKQSAPRCCAGRQAGRACPSGGPLQPEWGHAAPHGRSSLRSLRLRALRPLRGRNAFRRRRRPMSILVFSRPQPPAWPVFSGWTLRNRLPWTRPPLTIIRMLRRARWGPRWRRRKDRLPRPASLGETVAIRPFSP